MMSRVVTDSPEQTHKQAEEFLNSLSAKDKEAVVVGFTGPLAAGKTEFIRGLLRSAGVEGTVTSPTYTIETVYQLPDSSFVRAYHIDAYRLEDGQDLFDIGFEDRLADEEGIILIEWADRVENALPEDAICVDIEPDKDKRIITISNEQGE